MFLSNRQRVLAALILSIATSLVVTKIASAQSFSASPQAAPATPPILGVNDPQNPNHYTAQQQQIFYSLKVQYQQAAAAVVEDKTLTAAQKQAKIVALQQNAFATFKKSLSPAQQARVDVEASRQKQVLAYRTKSLIKYRALSNQLNGLFTPDEKKQILQIRTTAAAQANAINSGTQTMDVKQEQLMQLQSTVQQQLLGILTPAQKALVAQMKALNAAEPAAEAKILNGQ